MFINQVPIVQFAFFEFCTGNCYQIAVRARVEAGKVPPKIWIVRVEAAKVAQRIRIIPKHGTNYTSFCDLGRVRAEPIKIAPNFGTCTGENS